MPSVLIDIETMGTKADCAVLTIGAVQNCIASITK